jgi:hypothetical protein
MGLISIFQDRLSVISGKLSELIGQFSWDSITAKTEEYVKSALFGILDKLGAWCATTGNLFDDLIFQAIYESLVTHWDEWKAALYQALGLTLIAGSADAAELTAVAVQSADKTELNVQQLVMAFLV